MQRYRVLIHGENILTELDGVRQKVGFYTTVFVEAFMPADAASRAVEAVRGDARLRDIVLNFDNDPLTLSAEEIEEHESLDDVAPAKIGFALYSEEKA
jgi:hypothetical protein